MQPFSGNQRPDPVTSLMNMSPVLNLPRKKKHLYRSSSKTSKHAPKLVHLCILTSKCASRHNGVHFFDFSPSRSALRPRCFEHFDFQICFAPQPCAILYPPLLPKCLRTRRFSEPTSRPSGATKHWKNSVFRTFLPFRTL